MFFRTGNCSIREIPSSISMQLSESDTFVNRRRKKRDTTSSAASSSVAASENTILINTKASASSRRDKHIEPEQTSIVGTFRHVRLRHAKELLSVEPQKFVYSGSVSVPNLHMECSIWKQSEFFSIRNPVVNLIVKYIASAASVIDVWAVFLIFC